MKKLAFFVEGQTEQIFLHRLLLEIAGEKNISILLRKFVGKNRPSEEIITPKETKESNINHFVLIYDCGGDESVKSRILEEYPSLMREKYLGVIGIRDLYPLSNLNKLKNRLQNGLIIQNNIIEPALPSKAQFVIAVQEIETWFLAEENHYQLISEELTKERIEIYSNFNPWIDDATKVYHPSEMLRDIYSLAGKSYSKNRNTVSKTVECLDYSNIYLNLKHKIQSLNLLIDKIDYFLSLK